MFMSCIHIRTYVSICLFVPVHMHVHEAFLQNYMYSRSTKRCPYLSVVLRAVTLGTWVYVAMYLWLLHALSKYCPGFSVSAVGVT